jgi:hypothetical protein
LSIAFTGGQPYQKLEPTPLLHDEPDALLVAQIDHRHRISFLPR